MGSLVADLRTAARALKARPAFTAVAVLILALGIGANSAIFSVVHAVLLRPLPFHDPERLLWITGEISDFHLEMVPGADYLEWRDDSRLLAAVTAWDNPAWFLFKGREGSEAPERLQGARIAPNFLATLGVRPALGRSFLPDEGKPGGGRPVILTHRLWQRLFGAGTPLREQSLRLDDDVYTVVGVLPPDFMFPRGAGVDLVVPLVLDEAVERGRRQMTIVQVIARLKPGVTLAQARAELKTIQDRSIAAAEQAIENSPPGPGPGGPGGPRGSGGMQISIGRGGPPGAGPRGAGPRLPQPLLKVTSLREWIVGDIGPALLLMLGAVGLVLLIACADVANLLLARATARRQEIAIRAALGAGRGQIVRLLLAESIVLGLLGGLCGLALAFAALRPLVAMMPAGLAADLFHQTPVGIDGTVLAFTLLLAVGSAILFGLAPALAAARADLQSPLKEGARSGAGGGAPGGLIGARAALVVAEVALAVVLLVAAGLLLHSFVRLQAVDPGFDGERVLTLGINLEPQRYPSPASRSSAFQELASRLGALPGVEAVSYGDSVPLTNVSMIVRGLRVDGRPPLEPEQQPEVAITAVGPDYFRALGIRLRGRGFTAQDTAGAQPVAVISKKVAHIFWGDEDPLGRSFHRGPTVMTVVGVAADVKHDGLDGRSERIQMYMPFLQTPLASSFLVVRTKADPAAVVRSVRNVVLGLDRNIPVYNVATLRERLDASIADRRFNLTLLALFALLALVLAGVGLYGVLAYTVTERTHEIGIRMALGAERRRVLLLILRQGLTLAALGIALGLPASLLAGRVLRSSLFGITGADPATLVLIPLVLLAVALLAAWLPARRATRVEPIVALRNE